jgi:predicted nuclease of predicted toxin-antitoxin system
VNPKSLRLLADQNIHADVVRHLSALGFDVLHVSAAGLSGASDDDVLKHAYRENRVVLTHDRDFGRLAILSRQPVVGIVYLRPGHIDAAFTIETIDALIANFPNVTTPFVIVAERRGDTVRIRSRAV